MKVIDLLVKISKGEKVPKEIKWRGNMYEYSPIAAQYYIKDKIHNVDNSLRAALYDFSDLNNELEIIEKNKKIEHCLKSDRFLCDKAEMEHLRTKIDELIDVVNKLKGEK
jgi:hypothetical protein